MLFPLGREKLLGCRGAELSSYSLLDGWTGGHSCLHVVPCPHPALGGPTGGDTTPPLGTHRARELLQRPKGSPILPGSWMDMVLMSRPVCSQPPPVPSPPSRRVTSPAGPPCPPLSSHPGPSQPWGIHPVAGANPPVSLYGVPVLGDTRVPPLTPVSVLLARLPRLGVRRAGWHRWGQGLDVGTAPACSLPRGGCFEAGQGTGTGRGDRHLPQPPPPASPRGAHPAAGLGGLGCTHVGQHPGGTPPPRPACPRPGAELWCHPAWQHPPSVPMPGG